MLTPKQKQEIYDLLTATFDVGKPFWSPRPATAWLGTGIMQRTSDTKGLNKVLEDMPEYVRFEQVQNEDGNPFWQMVLKEPKKKKKRRKKVSGRYPLLCLSSRLHAGNLSRKNPPSDGPGRHRAADAGNRLPNRGEEKRITEKEDTCTFPTGLKNAEGEEISVFLPATPARTTHALGPDPRLRRDTQSGGFLPHAR